MHLAAEELNFERARELRDLIQHIEAVMVKQNIIMKDNLDRDVFGYAADKGMMCVQIFFVRQGKLIERDVAIFPYYGEEREDFLSYVTQFYHEKPVLPKEINLPEAVDAGLLGDWLTGVHVHIPQRGMKKSVWWRWPMKTRGLHWKNALSFLNGIRAGQWKRFTDWEK